MANPLPLTDDNGEVRELTREDFARMKPAQDILPTILGADIAAELLAKPLHAFSNNTKVSEVCQ